MSVFTSCQITPYYRNYFLILSAYIRKKYHLKHCVETSLSYCIVEIWNSSSLSSVLNKRSRTLKWHVLAFTRFIFGNRRLVFTRPNTASKSIPNSVKVTYTHTYGKELCPLTLLSGGNQAHAIHMKLSSLHYPINFTLLALVPTWQTSEQPWLLASLIPQKI